MVDWSPAGMPEMDLILPFADKAGGPWKPFAIPPDLSALGLHVGTAGWHFDDWAGRFYPPRAPRNTGVTLRDRFAFYQRYFSFVELNHTFYEEPLLRTFLELERRSKPGMRYAVKVHRSVSHKGAWDADEGKALMRRHAEAVSPLVDAGRFYSFLIQLDDRVERGPKALDYLLAAGAAAVAEGRDVHVEFRNRTWHQEPVLRALQDAGIGICNTEIPKLPHAFPRRAYATSAKGYIRYCGLNASAWSVDAGDAPRERLKAADARYDYLYSARELEERAREQLQLLRKTGSVAVVFKNHVRAQAPRNAIEAVGTLVRSL